MRFRDFGATVAAFFLAIALAGPAEAAADPAKATEFIEVLGARLVPILASDDRSDQVREDQLKDLISDGFELAVTGRFVLGKFWRRASKAQRKEYQALFADYVVNTAARRFAPFRDVKFKVVGNKKAGKKDIMVKSLLIRPDKEVPADWRVRKVGERYRLIDVNIAGISLAVTQRQDFAAVITSEGMEGVLKNLRAQVAEAKRSAGAATQ